MDTQRNTTEMTPAESVEYVSKILSGEVVTLREIFNVIGREGMMVFCIILTLPFMVPVSIPGVSTVFGLVIGLVGVGIITHRPPGCRIDFYARNFQPTGCGWRWRRVPFGFTDWDESVDLRFPF